MSGYYQAGRSFAWAIYAIVAMLIVGVVLVVGWLGFGWFAGEASIHSFAHTRAVYHDAYQYDRDLAALAENACLYRDRADKAKARGDADQYELLGRQADAVEARYAPTKADYDAAMADHFRAKEVKPGDLPRVAPTLQEAEHTAGCA